MTGFTNEQIIESTDRVRDAIRQGKVVSTTNSKRNNSTIKYHTNADCRMIDLTRYDYRVMSKERAQERGMEECKYCSGEFDPSSHRGRATVKKYRDMDPEDIL